MVNVCLVTMATGLYLTIVSSKNAQFLQKPKLITALAKWKLVPDNDHEAVQICNGAQNLCVSIAKGRQPDSFEPLILEGSDKSNEGQFWEYNVTSQTIRVPGSNLFWDIEHDDGPQETIQLNLNEGAQEKIDKFQILEC